MTTISRPLRLISHLAYTGNAGVNLFVQKDLYDSQFASFATVDGRSTILPVCALLTTTLLSGETGKTTITDKFQYGQKNKEGANRFVVFHDTSRKPYQVRTTPFLRL